MSQAITKLAVEEALENESFQCISLLGPWGTGKTHILNNTMTTLKQNKLVISLFGIDSVSQLRKTLLTELALNFITESTYAKRFKKITSSEDSASKNIFGHVASRLIGNNNELVSDSANYVLKKVNKPITIVFEDIERGNTIDLTAFLGVVETLRDNRHIKVVLVVNIDALGKKNRVTWSTFREKVIDKEIPLSISPEEAAVYASAKLPEAIRAPFLTTIEELELTNIRAIAKVAGALIEVSNKFGRGLTPDYAPLLRSTILFACIHWKLFKNSISFNELFDMYDRFYYKIESENISERKKQVATEWEDRLRRLKIVDIDEFERIILVNFYTTGYFDCKQCEKYLSLYDSKAKERAYLQTLNQFYYTYFWNTRISLSQIKIDRDKLIANCHLLDAKGVTQLLNFCEKYFPKENEVSKFIIDQWKTNIAEQAQLIEDHELIWNDNIAKPILELLKEEKDKEVPPVDAKSSWLKLYAEKSMTIQTKNLLQAVKTVEYKSILENASEEELRAIICTIDDYLYDRVTGHDFKETLIDYCKAVEQLKKKKNRLSDILSRLYPCFLSYH